MINNYGFAMKYLLLILLSLSIAFSNEYELTRISYETISNLNRVWNINDIGEVLLRKNNRNYMYCPEQRGNWQAGFNLIESPDGYLAGVVAFNNNGVLAISWFDTVDSTTFYYYIDETGEGSFIENPRGENGSMEFISINDANVMLVQAYGEGLGDNNGYYLMDKDGVIDEITDDLESVLVATHHIYGFNDLFDIVLLNYNNNSFDIFSTLDYSKETIYNLDENVDTQRILDFNDNGDIIIANSTNGDLFPAEPLVIMNEAKNGLSVGSNTFNLSDYGLVHFRPEGIDNNGIVWGVGRKDLSESNRYYIIIDGKIKLLDDLVEEELDEGYRIRDMSDNGTLLLDLNNEEFGILKPRLRILEPKADTTYVHTKHDSIRIKWSRPIQDDFIDISYKDLLESGEWIPIEELLELSDTEYMWLPINEELNSDSIVIKIESLSGKIIESDTISVRSLNLARKEKDGYYYLFDPSGDGWNVGNLAADLFPASYYGKIDYVNGIDPFTGNTYHPFFNEDPINAKQKDYPFWENFVRLFSEDACYNKYYDDITGELDFASVDARSLHLWSLIKEEDFDGACHGMTITSMLFFTDTTISEGRILFNVQLDDSHRDEIMQFQTFQNSSEWMFFRNIERNKPFDAGDIIRKYSDNFINNLNHQLMLIENSVTGHAVLPYKIESDNNAKDVFKLYYYDPALPFRSDQYFIMDTTENTFNKPGADWSKMTMDAPIVLYKNTPTMPRFNSIKKEKPKVLSDENLYFFKNDNSDITISSDQGVLTYENNEIQNEIEGAGLFREISNFPNKPNSGILPQNDYTISLTNSLDDVSSLSIFNKDVVYCFDNLEPEESDVDIIKYSDNIEYENANTRNKKVRFYFPGLVDSIGTMVMIENIDIPGNKKIELSVSDTNTFNIKAIDFTGNYDLKLISYYDKVNTTFEIKNNELGNLSEIEINIENDVPKVVIKTDSDGDGETDTIEEKTAEPTSVRIPQINLNVYPNPANDLVNFVVDSKASSKAKLIITNLRGGEIINKDIFISSGVNTLSENISNFNKGIYIITIQNGKQKYIGKIIKE